MRTTLLAGVLACAGGVVHLDAQSPLTLRRAIADALASSPLLEEPADDRVLADIREKQAAAQFGVKLSPTFQSGSNPQGVNQRTVGLAFSKRLPTGASLGFDANSYQFGHGATEFRDAGYTFNVSQPLLRSWSVARADVEGARRGQVSAARNDTDARQKLVLSVAQAYFAVLRASRRLTLATRTRDNAHHLRVSSEARAKVGLATTLDILRADLLASQAEASVGEQQEALDSAADDLNTLIGHPIGTPVTLSDTALTDVPEPPDETVDRVVQHATASRLDLREARDRIADARRNETTARWNLLPPVNLDVSYVKRGLGGTPMFDPFFNGWHVGVSTSYALDHSDQTAAAATATVSTRAAERAAENAERVAADEVRRAHRAWTRAASTVAIQTKAVDIAEQQLRLAQLRFQTGVASNFDVVDAENNLLQAQSALVDAQVERAVAGLILQRVSGVLDPSEFER